MFQKAMRAASPASALPNDTIEFTLDDEHRVDQEGEEPSRGFRLKRGPIRLESGEDLFSNSAYTVTIAFCRRAADDDGVLFSFDGSFVLKLEGNVIEASISTSMGERRLKVGGLNIAPGDWHRVALTFSGEDGRADLYLDGRRIASSADLSGATQAGNFFADLMIGSASERCFPGLLEDFRFLDAALGRDELAAL